MDARESWFLSHEFLMKTLNRHVKKMKYWPLNSFKLYHFVSRKISFHNISCVCKNLQGILFFSVPILCIIYEFRKINWFETFQLLYLQKSLFIPKKTHNLLIEYSDLKINFSFLLICGMHTNNNHPNNDHIRKQKCVFNSTRKALKKLFHYPIEN